jgi:hypothetical protein
MDGFVLQRRKQGPWRQRQRKVTETADMQQIGVPPVRPAQGRLRCPRIADHSLPGWIKTTLRTTARRCDAASVAEIMWPILLISQQRSDRKIACIAVWAFFLSRYRQYGSARTATAPGGLEPVARAHESPALRVTERGQGERACDPRARLGHGNCRKHDVIAIAAGVID